MTVRIVGIKYVCNAEKLDHIAKYIDVIKTNEDMVIVDLAEVGLPLLKQFLDEKDIKQINKEHIGVIIFINANADFDKILL